MSVIARSTGTLSSKYVQLRLVARIHNIHNATFQTFDHVYLDIRVILQKIFTFMLNCISLVLIFLSSILSSPNACASVIEISPIGSLVARFSAPIKIEQVRRVRGRRREGGNRQTTSPVRCPSSLQVTKGGFGRCPAIVIQGDHGGQRQHCVDFIFEDPQCCPSALQFQPNLLLPKQN